MGLLRCRCVLKTRIADVCGNIFFRLQDLRSMNCGSPNVEFMKGYWKRLFSLINDLPTFFEVVTERKPLKDKPSVDGGSKSKNSTKRSSDGQAQKTSKSYHESNGEEEDEHSDTLCGSCGGDYRTDEFWICCDVCERWFHGKCVRITLAKAENMKQYKCPSCTSKRSIHSSFVVNLSSRHRV